MITIPLSKLISGNDNVRKTGATDGIGELVASIAAHGLLQSLVVRKAKRGKFAVIAGQRRFLALSMLAGDADIAADMPVPCTVVGDDADATEIGLAENVVRAPMHPADQFEAFRDLVDKGSTPADVAARFGVAESTVAKRLKLGRVSPALLAAYRNGEMSLEQVQAFTVSDDHSAQERVWAGLPPSSRRPGDIRGALTLGEIPATDKLVRLVTLEAYEAADGAVRRDLFDDRNAGYVLDAALLDRLVREKLETTAEAVRAEGWKWTEIHPDFDYDTRCRFRRCHPEDAPLPEAEAAELERLTANYDELAGILENDGENDEAAERLEEIEQRIDELNDLGQVWTTDTKAIAGAVVFLSGNDGMLVERGLIRPEDAPARAGVDESAADGDAQTAPVAKLPATLIRDLTAQKTAAIAAELVRRPEVALAAVVHALARPLFFDYGAETCLKISTSGPSLDTAIDRPDDCRGFAALFAEYERWADQLPANPDDLWNWCLAQPQDKLLDLLAVCAAHTLDAVQVKDSRQDAASLHHADSLAEALKVDMTAWFTPTAANFFSRISRPVILEMLAQAQGKPPIRSVSQLKKPALVAHAERAVVGTGWLPCPLLPIAGTAQPGNTESEVLIDEAA